MEKTRLKSVVSWVKVQPETSFLETLPSREEEGMMGGKADKHLPPRSRDHLP